MHSRGSGVRKWLSRIFSGSPLSTPGVSYTFTCNIIDSQMARTENSFLDTIKSSRIPQDRINFEAGTVYCTSCKTHRPFDLFVGYQNAYKTCLPCRNSRTRKVVILLLDCTFMLSHMFVHSNFQRRTRSTWMI